MIEVKGGAVAGSGTLLSSLAGEIDTTVEGKYGFWAIFRKGGN
jgi:hypothetical protein